MWSAVGGGVTYLRNLDHGGRLHVGQLLDTPLAAHHVTHL